MLHLKLLATLYACSFSVALDAEGLQPEFTDTCTCSSVVPKMPLTLSNIHKQHGFASFNAVTLGYRYTLPFRITFHVLLQFPGKE